MAFENLFRCIIRKWRTAGQHLIQCNPERVHIRLTANFIGFSSDNFRRRIQRGRHDSFIRAFIMLEFC